MEIKRSQAAGSGRRECITAETGRKSEKATAGRNRKERIKAGEPREGVQPTEPSSFEGEQLVRLRRKFHRQLLNTTRRRLTSPSSTTPPQSPNSPALQVRRSCRQDAKVLGFVLHRRAGCWEAGCSGTCCGGLIGDQHRIALAVVLSTHRLGPDLHKPAGKAVGGMAHADPLLTSRRTACAGPTWIILCRSVSL